MSKGLKTFLFAIWGVLLIPLIGNTLEKWLEENVLPEPNAWATIISNKLIAMGQLRWFNFALLFMSGAIVGVLLESLAHRSRERKAFEVKSLGYKFGSLSDGVKSRTTSGWPDNVRDLRPAITTALASAQKFDLWVPSERVYKLPDASFLCEYFSCVGRLLEVGHLDEASREALSWKPFLDRETLP